MTRLLSIAAAGLLMSLPAAAGEPVLLPDFTPATTSDFSLAALLQQVTEEGLARSGHVVLLDDAVATVVGDDALTACFDEPDCPQTALGMLPARFGVVVRVRREGDRVFGDVRLYEQTGTDPLESQTYEVEPGEEAAFGRKIADLINDLAIVMGPAEADDLLAAAKLISAAQARAAGDGPGPADPNADPDAVVVVRRPLDPTPDDPRADDPQPDPVDSTPEVPLTDGARLAQAFDDTGFSERHLVGVEQHFLDKMMDIRDWNYKHTPHAGRVIIEVRGGIGIGDVDRVAHVRTTITEGEQSKWFQEGPSPASRLRGELYVGYAPSAWVDIGMVAGLQYGQRILDSGWTDDLGGGDSAEDSGAAVQFVLQPRLRFYPVRTGPVKPYLFGGASLRFFDRWKIVPVSGIEYGEPPAGLVPGPMGGVGLLIDPSPMVGLFAEGSYAHCMGTRAAAAEITSVPEPAGAPAAVQVDGRVISVVGGVQFRL